MRKMPCIMCAGIAAVSLSLNAVNRAYNPKDFSSELGVYGDRNYDVLKIGYDICKGCLVSFDLEYKSPSTSAIEAMLTDARDGKWILSGEGRISFRDLKTPLHITLKKDYHSLSSGRLDLKFSNVNTEFDDGVATKDLIKGRLPRKAEIISVFSSNIIEFVDVDLKGKFFDNFEADFECHRLTILGNNGETIHVLKETPNKFVRRIALPMIVKADPVCQSSRLEKPENINFDYEADFQIWPVI